MMEINNDEVLRLDNHDSDEDRGSMRRPEGSSPMNP
jgi:hypothetical protein